MLLYRCLKTLPLLRGILPHFASENSILKAERMQNSGENPEVLLLLSQRALRGGASEASPTACYDCVKPSTSLPRPAGRDGFCWHMLVLYFGGAGECRKVYQ